MSTISSIFGPQNEKEKVIFAQENLIGDVQELICEMMHEQGKSYDDLAALLNTNVTRVKYILDGTEKLTLETLAHVFYVLNAELKFTAIAKNEHGKC